MTSGLLLSRDAVAQTPAHRSPLSKSDKSLLAPGAKSVQARGPWPSGALTRRRFVTRRGAIVPFGQGRSFVRQPRVLPELSAHTCSLLLWTSLPARPATPRNAHSNATSTPAASPPCGTSNHANGAMSPPRRRLQLPRDRHATDASYTAINRRITEGRDRLRKLAHERDTPSDKEAEMGAKIRPPRRRPSTMGIQPRAPTSPR